MKYLKDKKIILYKVEQRIINNEGFVNRVLFKPIHEGRLWVYVRQLDASEIINSAALKLSEEMLFVINWRNDINTKVCFLCYKDILYDITRVDTFEGYKEDLKLYAKRIINQPKPEDFLEYSNE